MHTLLICNLHMKDINPVQGGWEHCQPGHDFGPAVRGYYLLHYVLKGSGYFKVGGVMHTLHAGDMFVIHPLETTYYAADKTDPWEYVWIGFEAGIELPETLKKSVVRCPKAYSIFHALIQAERMQQGREQFLCGLIWQLLSYFVEQESEDRLSPERAVQIAVTFIETEYANEISIVGLSERLHLNRSYFYLLFKRATGVSPQQYLTNVRLKKAADLLLSFGYTPGETAASTGYADLSSFSRMFKRHYGLSPTAYTNQNRYAMSQQLSDAAIAPSAGQAPVQSRDPHSL